MLLWNICSCTLLKPSSWSHMVWGSLAFIQNKKFMQLSREGWKCDPSALKLLYREKHPTLCFKTCDFYSNSWCGEEVRAKGREKSWSKVSDCWIWATWCCAPPVNTQRPFLISASIELQNKFMQKSFSYFLSEEFTQPVIYSRIILQQGRRKKKAGGAVPLLWIIHPILPEWVLGDPFA